MILRKTYLNKIKPFINLPIIKVLTGIRRCGKSELLKQIQNHLLSTGVLPSQIISINLESSAFFHIQNGMDLIEEVRREIGEMKDRVYIFLDEIQEVSGWERAVNAFRVDFDCDIYITGSNSTLLSGELASHLSGRYVEIKVYPFSFQEFLELIKDSHLEQGRNQAFDLYLRFGGMPFLHYLNYEEDPSRQYLDDLFTSVIIKDVVSRNNIRDVDLLQRLVHYLISSIGHPFSARSISAYFKNESRRVAPETIINYIKACVDACLFHPVKREDLIGKKILQVDEKYYLADHGIRQAVYGENMRDIHLVLENMVCMELLRQSYDVTVGRVGDKEIDFVAQKKSKKLYVQVSYLIAEESTLEREIAPLLMIQDNFPKLIVSMDPVTRSTQGIEHLHISDFLLNSESL